MLFHLASLDMQTCKLYESFFLFLFLFKYSHSHLCNTCYDLQGNADYFLNSGDKIRFFFEKGVFNDKG